MQALEFAATAPARGEDDSYRGPSRAARRSVLAFTGSFGGT